MHKISYEWLRLLETALTKAKELPFSEERFSFPWEEFSCKIKNGFNLADLEMSSESLGWKSSVEALQFLGEDPVVLAIEATPIDQVLFFAMSRHDVACLVSQTLDMDKEGFFREQLQEGFYHFLFLRVLQAIDELKVFKNLTFQLTSVSSFIQEEALCVDVIFSLPKKRLRGRVIFPSLFLSAFKTFLPVQKETLLDVFQQYDKRVTLAFDVGKITILSQDWNSVKVGDFVVLDKCLYDPIEKKGSVTCRLGTTPLFVARIKPDGLKVLSFVFSESPSSVSSDYVVLSVETNRSEVSVQKLLSMYPDTMIDIIERPDLEVDLVIRDTKVGRGELLFLSNVIGVRVVDLQSREQKDSGEDQPHEENGATL
jgi:hypothetical protein